MTVGYDICQSGEKEENYDLIASHDSVKKLYFKLDVGVRMARRLLVVAYLTV